VRRLAEARRDGTAGARPGAAAFTLLELMLAIAIFALVITAIYGIWSAILRASLAGREVSADAQRVRIAARTVETALTCAVMFEQNRDLYAFEADTSEEFAVLSFVARLPRSFPGSGFFGDLAIRRVTFEVAQTDEGENELRLIQHPILEEDPRASDERTIVLARGVTTFMAEFSDGRSDQWTDVWADPISGQPWTNQLPRAVRFALAFGKPETPNQPRQLTVRTVYIPSAVVRRVYQSPMMPAGGRRSSGLRPSLGPK